MLSASPVPMVYSQDTQPHDLRAGVIWYNTTLNNLFICNGTTYNALSSKYDEITSITTTEAKTTINISSLSLSDYKKIIIDLDFSGLSSSGTILNMSFNDGSENVFCYTNSFFDSSNECATSSYMNTDSIKILTFNSYCSIFHSTIEINLIGKYPSIFINGTSSGYSTSSDKSFRCSGGWVSETDITAINFINSITNGFPIGTTVNIYGIK